MRLMNNSRISLSGEGQTPASKAEFLDFMDQVQNMYDDPTTQRSYSGVAAQDDSQLAAIFERLVAEYPNTNALHNVPLPVTVGELRSVYDSINGEFGGGQYRFVGSDSDKATVVDLQVLFRKVMENYSYEEKSFDLENSQKDALSRIFEKLAGHYSQDNVHKTDQGAGELYSLYELLDAKFEGFEELVQDEMQVMEDEIEEELDLRNNNTPTTPNFNFSESELNALYDQLIQGEKFELRLENEMIGSFEELKMFIQKKQDEKLDGLMDKFDEIGGQEDQTEEYIDELDEELMAELDTIYDKVTDESERLTRIENFLRQQAIEGGNEALPLLESPTSLNTEEPVTNEPKLEDEMEIEAHKMVVYILGAIAVAVAGGVCLGGIVIYCIMACCKRD